MKSRVLIVAGLAAVFGSSVTLVTPAQGGVIAAKKHQRPRHNRPAEMVKALEQLRAVQRSLARAGERYDGHRAKAVDHINEAIREVQAGLDYADRH